MHGLIFCLQCMIVQYGRILDIDLKIPPRPPGYAFVEVRIFSMVWYSIRTVFFYGACSYLNIYIATALLHSSVLQPILDSALTIQRKRTDIICLDMAKHLVLTNDAFVV